MGFLDRWYDRQFRDDPPVQPDRQSANRVIRLLWEERNMFWLGRQAWMVWAWVLVVGHIARSFI